MFGDEFDVFTSPSTEFSQSGFSSVPRSIDRWLVGSLPNLKERKFSAFRTVLVSLQKLHSTYDFYSTRLNNSLLPNAQLFSLQTVLGIFALTFDNERDSIPMKKSNFQSNFVFTTANNEVSHVFSFKHWSHFLRFQLPQTNSTPMTSLHDIIVTAMLPQICNFPRICHETNRLKAWNSSDMEITLHQKWRKNAFPRAITASHRTLQASSRFRELAEIDGFACLVERCAR